MIVTSLIGFGKSKKEKSTSFQSQSQASTRVWLQCIVKTIKGFDDFALVLLFQSVSPLLLVETVPRVSTSFKSYEWEIFWFILGKLDRELIMMMMSECVCSRDI